MTLIVVNGNFANMLKSFQILCPSLYISKSRKTLKKNIHFHWWERLKSKDAYAKYLPALKNFSTLYQYTENSPGSL